MRVLITGVAGFLGSNFARWILKNQPHVDVIGVDDLSSGYKSNVPPNMAWKLCKISELSGGDYYDTVFHFASFAAEVYSHECRRFTIDRVWGETAALLNTLQKNGCGKLVFTSSIAVYGALTAPFYEDDELLPNDPYGIAKLACEHDIRCSGLPYVILRPHNIYGPYQNLWDTQRNVFGKWMRCALDGKQATIFGDGLQQRAFTYVDDILPLIWKSAELNGEAINIGASEPISILGAWHKFVDATGYTKFQRQSERNEVQIAYSSNEKCQRLLGKIDETPLNIGLAKMWEWAKIQEKREFLKPPCKEI